MYVLKSMLEIKCALSRTGAFDINCRFMYTYYNTLNELKPPNLPQYQNGPSKVDKK